MSDFQKSIANTLYDGVITEAKDGIGQPCFTIALQTIVEEGETPEKKFRLNLGSLNPLTMVPFGEKGDVLLFAINATENLFAPWFDDPAPEEEGE